MKSVLGIGERNGIPSLGGFVVSEHLFIGGKSVGLSVLGPNAYDGP